MSRCGIFIDAGYLFAEGGKLCLGTRSRSKIVIDASGLVEMLAGRATRETVTGVLRTYWYDGARDGVPSTQQLMVAALPNVKLRLGRVNSRGEQKGVDALIYRDLMTLARERAISDAYLLSGDEDLREGVRSAQDLGVRVSLIGISPVGESFNQSQSLVHEADTVSTLSASDLGPFFVARRLPSGVSTNQPRNVVRESARAFASDWVSRVDNADLDALHAVRPSIPKPLDVDLITQVEQDLGMVLRGSEDLRRTARSAFWDAIPAGSSN
ncbi:MAG: NYN domain-containing protein [Euzebya sp.]